MNQIQEQKNKYFHTYEEAVDWVTGLVSFGIKPGLRRMEALAKKLGNPERRLKFIHVAGTNGKGSTCAFMNQVLMECGYRVGMFTSPYLENFTNRIEMNGHSIAEEAVLSLINKIKPIVDEVALTELGHPTMFEVVTSMALDYYARDACPDFVIWETGLGGRLDCTNIVVPVVSVITNIGHDHMDILGDTLEKVAEEKAGIVKSGVPVISTVEQPEVVEVIHRVAKQKNTTLYLLGKQFDYKSLKSGENNQVISFSGPFQQFPEIPISLNGTHQMKNAALAIMTLEVLRQYYAVLIDEEQIIAGLSQTKWPGRLEMIHHQPRILLDGAHNPEGAETLALALKHTYSYDKVHFMIGMLATKNHEAYLRHILPLVNTLIITEPEFRSKMEVSKLLRIVEKLKQEMDIQDQIHIIVEPSWKRGIEQLKELTNSLDLAVVSGTLYLISDVRSWILHHLDSDKGW